MGLLLSAVGVVIVALYFGPTAVIRYFDPETRLGSFEWPITGVANEFMRRSPALKANFERFGECGRQGRCNYTPILAERDRIIAAEWPSIFDRVAIRDDWWSLGEYLFPPSRTEQYEVDRDAFFDELKARGAETLRNHCVPKVIYQYRAFGRTTYDTWGFVCPSQQPDRKRPG